MISTHKLTSALFAVLAACAVLSAERANAQQTTVEETVTVSDGGYIQRPRERYNVYIFGDRFGEGLTAGFTRLFARRKNFRLVNRSRRGSGLSRPDLYDWNLALAKILEGKQVDIAVVMLGANDTASVATETERYQIGTPLWRKAYAAHIDRFLATLKAHGTAVYWVGLPIMAKGNYDKAVQVVNEVQRERVEAAEMKFISLRRTFSDDKGNYTDSGFGIEGKFVRLRSRNGVHFIKRGNDKLVSVVHKFIAKDVKSVESGGLEAFEETVGGKAKEVRTSALNIPIFGQVTETGAAIPVDLGPKITLVTREARQGQGTQGGARLTVPSGSTSTFAPRVAPGSPAARVLVDGEAVAAKRGRADDFSWPEQ